MSSPDLVTPPTDARPPLRFECSTAARWLPRILGGAVLSAAYIAAQGIDPEGALSGSATVRVLVMVSGVALAIWIVRVGSVMQRAVELGASDLGVGTRRRMRRLELRDITTLDYHAPFASGRQWVPVVTLGDRLEQQWELPAVVERAGLLLDELLARSDRSDLEAWVDARRIRPRLGRARRVVPIGYAVAFVTLAAAMVFYLR